MKNNKRFFYFPTWTLYLIAITFLCATLFDVFLVLNFESFQNTTMTINGKIVEPGSVEYKEGLREFKIIFSIASVFTMLVSFTAAFFVVKRKKADNIKRIL